MGNKRVPLDLIFLNDATDAGQRANGEQQLRGKVLCSVLAAADLNSERNVRDALFEDGKMSDICRDIYHTLEYEPETFVDKNKGLTISVKALKDLDYELIRGVRPETDTKVCRKATLVDSSIIDGAQTFSMIRRAHRNNLDISKAVCSIEILVGFSREREREITLARNSNHQMQERSVQNLEGRFDGLKKALEALGIADKFAYKESDRATGLIGAENILRALILCLPGARSMDAKLHYNKGVAMIGKPKHVFKSWRLLVDPKYDTNDERLIAMRKDLYKCCLSIVGDVYAIYDRWRRCSYMVRNYKKGCSAANKKGCNQLPKGDTPYRVPPEAFFLPMFRYIAGFVTQDSSGEWSLSPAWKKYEATAIEMLREMKGDGTPGAVGQQEHVYTRFRDFGENPTISPSAKDLDEPTVKKSSKKKKSAK